MKMGQSTVLALAATVGLFLASDLSITSLHAQTVGSPQSMEEKRPTPRDPTYIAPMVPPYLRDIQPDAATELLLNPDSVRQRVESYPEVEDRLREEVHTRNRLEMDGDRKYLEDRYLQQYGMDSYDYRFPYSETFEEDGWRRVQITFFLSLPITAGFTYGAMSLSKQSAGQGNAFSGPETAALAGFSILFSGLIAWYDYENWLDWKRGNEEDLSYLTPPEIKRQTAKQRSKRQEHRAGGFFHPLWLDDGSDGRLSVQTSVSVPRRGTRGSMVSRDGRPGGLQQSGTAGFAYSWRF